MSRFEDLIQRQDKIDCIVNFINDEKIIAKNLLLKERILNPAHYVVMLGETSSGKSTLINSILKNNVLIEGVRPTTSIISEVVITQENCEQFFAINKDSSCEELEEEIFKELTIKPDEDLKRLRYEGKSIDNKYTGMRVFDTPGYGSLVKSHEEVLKNFIPESDFILYVVSYRVGLGDDDYQFLKYVGGVISEDTEVVLVINMCPTSVSKSDKRITEIQDAVNECIHRKVKVFCISRNQEKIIKEKDVWDYIYKRANDENKREELKNTLKLYQDYILDDCKIKIDAKLANAELNEDELIERMKMTREFLSKKQEIFIKIDEKFEQISKKSVEIIGKSSMSVNNKIYNYIYDESKWTKKEETLALMQNYYIPKMIGEETEKLTYYIEEEITALDREIENILNTAIKNLKRKVEIEIPIYTEILESLLKKHIGDGINSGAIQFFKQYAGNGGVGAGVANGAKKGLKKFGNLFGHTFSRETHNNLAKFLKTVKATSVKGLTVYLNVLTETIFYLHDSLTWQKKLNTNSKNAIEKWKIDISNTIVVDLKELKEENESNIDYFFEDIKDELELNKSELDDIDKNSLLNLKKEILNIKIGE